MDSRVPQLAEQLLLIERELRLLGWWDVSPPEPHALASPEPFCVDTLTFEQWLQWIFLPRMKTILEQGLPLPTASGIREMADLSFASRAEARNLLRLLGEFDALITGAP